MAWTKEFDEILQGVLRRSDSTLLYSDELEAISEIAERGFEAVKNNEDVNILLRNLDTDNLTDSELEVVHYAQTLAEENYHNLIEQQGDIISSQEYHGMRYDGHSHEDIVAMLQASEPAERSTFDKALGHFNSQNGITEAEANLLAQRVSNLSDAELKITEVRFERVEDIDDDGYGGAQLYEGTTYRIDFELGGVKGQIDAYRDAGDDDFEALLDSVDVEVNFDRNVSAHDQAAVRYLMGHEGSLRDTVKAAAMATDGDYYEKSPEVQDASHDFRLGLAKIASDQVGIDSDPHAYEHPNYGGSESPDYEFFDVFRTAGQDEGVYCMDVPLPQSARELFEDEPASHVPSDPNRNFYRLEIAIGDDGHPNLVRDGSEGDGLDEHLFDVYNASIRAGAETFAREHGLIADEIQPDMDVPGDWNDYDPVPEEVEYDNPANAEWADFHETAKASAEGISLREVDGQMVATLEVPDHIAKRFDFDTLDARGVQFDADNRAELFVTIKGGQLELDRQFMKNSYQGRFEDNLFNHHRDALQQEAERQAAEAAATQRRVEDSIAVAAHSDFEGNTAQQRHLDIRVDGQDFTVVATFDDSGRVSAIDVDPDQIGSDPALDGGSRYRELTSLLDKVRDPITQRVQEYNDNVDDRVLRDTGWLNSRTLDAGYAVISEEEIDRLGAGLEKDGQYLLSGDFRTTEGYPIRLEFDANANVEVATIPGTKTSLKPVLENSRDHFVEAKAQLADHGLVLSKAESGDYRVDYHKSSSSYREGERGSAQFTDTVSGATEIGHKMAAEREKQVLRSVAQDNDRERMVA